MDREFERRRLQKVKEVYELKELNFNVDKSSKKYILFSDWLIPFICALAFVLCMRSYFLSVVLIPSGSMEPTIMTGDRLLVTNIYRKEKIERGDIVVFNLKEANEPYIKRVIGLPGDKIALRHGKIYVNDELIKEDYIEEEQHYRNIVEEFRLTNGDYHVPQDSYFFLGDNRDNSSDSRDWENPYVHKDDITGKAQFRVYPFDKIGKIN